MNSSPSFFLFFFTVEKVNIQRLKFILSDMVRRSQDTVKEVCSLRDSINFHRRQHGQVTPYTELVYAAFNNTELLNQLLREIQYKHLDIVSAVCGLQE